MYDDGHVLCTLTTRTAVQLAVQVHRVLHMMMMMLRMIFSHHYVVAHFPAILPVVSTAASRLPGTYVRSLVYLVPGTPTFNTFCTLIADMRANQR